MQPIILRTFSDYLEHGHGLACWCPGCRRFASCDLAELVRNGLGNRDPATCRPRCRVCGATGEWRVQGPVPLGPDLGGRQAIQAAPQRSNVVPFPSTRRTT